METRLKADEQPAPANKTSTIGDPSSAVEDAADRMLVGRMAQGEEAALGELYDRWADLVFSVSAMIVDREDAEEVLESTFWQAWQTADTYDPKSGKVSTWLTMIARSRSLDRRRKFKRRSESVWADEAAKGFQTKSECPLSSTINHERAEIVAKAMERLPAEQRETLQLAFFGGLSQREIADKLKQPLGTVKTRARLASNKLKQYLSVLSDAPHEQY